MKNLPIGISTLSTIINENKVYIDKTGFIHRQLKTGTGRYFLSRPRRFGKSLLVDTFKEIFEGHKELFKGLYIYDKWDWNRRYPVIKIDFVAGCVRNRDELDNRLIYILKDNAERLNIDVDYDTDIPGIFTNVIKSAFKKYNEKVVILVDEYDKPLLDNIENVEVMKEVRDGLKSFYSVIKDQDANIQFVFLTGVSKFSKVNIFSGINNLQDITLDENYSAICGYTQNDIETVFKEHLEGVDLEELRRWYNGYNFLGESVYNPFDILLFISKNKQYRNYWFETGTPTFLVKLFQKNNYFLPDLEEIEVGEEILSSFDIEKIKISTLLFQTGYLTVKGVSREFNQFLFKLGYPNEEVKTSLNKYLIEEYSEISENKVQYEKNIYYSIINGDLTGLEKVIRRLFSSIPYRNFTNNELLESEGYYASVLYAFFASVNCEVIPEDITNRGQCDMTVKLGNNIYVMEIKVIEGERESDKNSALEQIETMNYSQKYIGITGTTVYEVGMIFSKIKRNLVMFDWRKILK